MLITLPHFSAPKARGPGRHWRTGLLLAALAAAAVSAGCADKPPRADLDRVLDVTVATLTSLERRADRLSEDQVMYLLAEDMTRNMNQASPPVHPGPIGVLLAADGSLLGFQDKNGNSAQDSDDPKLFTVEIDAEKGRLIATDVGNTVRDHSIHSGGLLAGYVLGNLLNRQKVAGVSPASLSSKTAVARSDYASARTRAGSGSHSSGK